MVNANLTTSRTRRSCSRPTNLLMLIVASLLALLSVPTLDAEFRHASHLNDPEWPAQLETIADPEHSRSHFGGLAMKSNSRNLVKLGAAAAALSLGFLTLSASADEPCTPHWDNTIGQPGISAIVRALTVYNGNVIAGGDFITAGGQTVNRIARWDGEEWHPFTSGGQIGVDDNFGTIAVSALTVYNGDLIAGGSFNTAGGQTVYKIARWDGSAWHPFESGGQIGMNISVLALTVYNGDLIAGGSFTTAGGQTVNRIARWDGEEWHPLTSGGQIGVSGDQVYALMVYNGDLIAGGFFTTAGGQTVNLIARWDGKEWHPFTSGGQTGVNLWVYACAEYSGDLIAGGTFITAGGQPVNRIARWDGEEWHPLASGGQIGVGAQVFALAVDNGELTAAGHVSSAGGEEVNRIATWVTPESAGPGDLNCDGLVDVFDLLVLLGAWGVCDDPGDCPADLSGDGAVNIFDLLQLLGAWT